MLTPEQIASLPDNLLHLYGQAEADILASMAKRIAAFDDFPSSVQWQYIKLREMGLLHDEIIKVLAAATKKAVPELMQIMNDAGAKALAHDDTIYRANGLDPAPVSASPQLQQVLKTGLQKTNGLFDNLTSTTAKTATRQFEHALDRAHMQVTTGAFSRQEAVLMAVKQLSREGVQTIDYRGCTTAMDVAVARAVRTGVNQTALRLSDAHAEEMGCDLVETTAHSGARPSHAEWQGKVFSRSGKSKQHPDFVNATGYGSGDGLGGWNCRHSFYPYFEGDSRQHTAAQLDELAGKTVTVNGEEMSLYDATQRQREIERNIRRWKREYTAMEAAGLDTAESALKLRSWREAEKDFCRQTGLKPQAERTQVVGFGKSAAQKANLAAKKQIKDFAQQHISSVSLLSPLQNQQIGNTMEVEAKRFLDRAEADKFFRPWTENLWHNFGIPEREALYEYTTGSEKFNRPLRGYDKSWDNFKGVGRVPLDNEGAGEMISDLTSALDKAAIKEDVWLFRGSDQQSLSGMLGIDKSKIIPSNIKALNKKFSGADIMDSAFFSTGISADAGFKDRVSYEILAPKGTKGLYVEPFSKYGYNETSHIDSAQYGTEWDGQYHPGGVGSEAEVILQRGTCFKIKAINEVAGKVNVILEIIS